MVENLYVAERLGREKVQDYLTQAEQHRLQTLASEAPRPAPRGETRFAGGSASTPAPRRA